MVSHSSVVGVLCLMLFVYKVFMFSVPRFKKGVEQKDMQLFFSGFVAFI